LTLRIIGIRQVLSRCRQCIRFQAGSAAQMGKTGDENRGRENQGRVWFFALKQTHRFPERTRSTP